MISLLLVHWNLLPLPLLYLSAYFERRRQEYYDLLLAVSAQGAWRAWVAFFLRGVIEQAHDANARAKRLQDLQLDWRRQLQHARTSGLLAGIADYLFELPVISAGEVQNRFGVSHPTAMHALRQLTGMQFLQETTGKERNRVYQAEAILKIVD